MKVSEEQFICFVDDDPEAAHYCTNGCPFYLIDCGFAHITRRWMLKFLAGEHNANS